MSNDNAEDRPANQMQSVVEVAGLDPFYANFARVTGSPEELILDFGLNPQPFGAPTSPISIQRRLVLNFFTAKRLLAALSMAVQRHEMAFGVLETDVNKRVTPQLRAAQAQQAAK
jgi:hypothetical protein